MPFMYIKDCLAHSVFHDNKRSIDNDNHSNQTTASQNNVVPPQPTTAPPWLKELLDGSWYGSEQYMQRDLYLKDPSRKPTICFSNVTKDKNGTLLKSFICPMSDLKDDKTYCCGDLFNQHCCTLKERDGDGDDDDIPLIQDIDIVTGISIAVGFVLSVTICMSLYCCCCQRRPEIHDGIKLMWVRRSFGKELNRLEEPMYQNQLTVGGRGSKNPSRSGSQQHSRSGSRNPSRNASRDCSPSVSRRGSHQTYNKLKDDEKSKLKVPGGVTITLTTPSDEQGPTNPLLKQTQEHIEST